MTIEETQDGFGIYTTNINGQEVTVKKIPAGMVKSKLKSQTHIMKMSLMEYELVREASMQGKLSEKFSYDRTEQCMIIAVSNKEELVYRLSNILDLMEHTVLERLELPKKGTI